MFLQVPAVYVLPLESVAQSAPAVVYLPNGFIGLTEASNLTSAVWYVETLPP